MNTLLLVVILIIVLIIILSLAWRMASTRSSIPCPVWMKWLLDPPSFQKISGGTRKTIEYLNVKPGMDMLDAGCGPGRLAIPLAERTGPAGTVTVMDIQEGMLAEVRKRAEKDKLTNIRYVQEGIGDGRLPERAYDRIVMITVIGEIPERNKAMQEIYQALKPGGILLIEETIRDPHFQRRQTIRAMAEELGLIERGLFGGRFNYTILLEKPKNNSGTKSLSRSLNYEG